MVLEYFGGCHTMMFYCILKDHCKNLRDCFGLQKHLEKHCSHANVHCRWIHISYL